MPSNPSDPTTVTLRAAAHDRDGGRSRRPAASIWRFRSYLRPYRWRFVLLVVFSVAGIAASILVPLVTRRVIDGPIAQSDRQGLYALGALAIAVGVGEALLMFGRRWIVSKATLGVETDIRVQLYAKLQRLPLAFHSRWESGQLLSRITSDLSTIRRFLGFGLVFLLVNILQILVVVGILIHLYWPLGLVVLASTIPVTWVSLRTEKVYTRLSRAVQDQTGDVASSVEEMAHAHRVHQVIRPGGPHLRRLRPAQRPAARHGARPRPGPVVVLHVPGRHPQRHPHHRADPRCAGRRPGTGHAGDARRLHDPDDVAGLAGDLARIPALDDAGRDDRCRPDRGDLRRREHHRRRDSRPGSGTRRAGVRRRLVPVPGLARPTSCTT